MLLVFVFSCVSIFAAGSAVMMASTLGHPIVVSRKTEHLDLRVQELVRLMAIAACICVSWCGTYLAFEPTARWTAPFENHGGTGLTVILTVVIGYYIFQIPNNLERRVTAFVDTYAFDLQTVADVRQKIIGLLNLARNSGSKVYILSAAPVPLIELAENALSDEVFKLLDERVREKWSTAFLTYSWLDAQGHRDTTAGKFFQALAKRESTDASREDVIYRSTFARSLLYLSRFLRERQPDAGPDDITQLQGVHMRLLKADRFQFNPNSISMSVVIQPDASSQYSYLCISGTKEDLSKPGFLPIEGGAQPAAARRMLIEFNEKWRFGEGLPREVRTAQQEKRDDALIDLFSSADVLRPYKIDKIEIDQTYDVFPASISLETKLFIEVTKVLLNRFYESSQDRQKAHLVDLGCGTGAIGVACADAAASVTFVDILKAAVDLSRSNWQKNWPTPPAVPKFEHADGTDWIGDYLKGVNGPVLVAFNQPLYGSLLNLFNLGSNCDPYQTLTKLAQAIVKSPHRSGTVMLVSSSPELSHPIPEKLNQIPGIVTKPLMTDPNTQVTVVAVYDHRNSDWAAAIEECAVGEAAKRASLMGD